MSRITSYTTAMAIIAPMTRKDAALLFMGLAFDEVPDGGEYGGTHGKPYGEFKEVAHAPAFPAETGEFSAMPWIMPSV